ncbi:MAG TPA: M48 family metallopeptidase [Deltaproteobacteria bacterium]|nr:M48 family metallopeptidase [Deltaproteobacteria bacterium]HPR55400.1 M48 family metallopeptidase [Deltaproteobacteria bacterium]HXK48239.1 M48 family metallopeptidase [Deltaproteobacteria bacterium]
MTVFIDDVGEVLVVHSKRARRMSITVCRDRVRVAVPIGLPLSMGRDLALAKRDWISRHLSRLNSLEESVGADSGLLPPPVDPAAAREKIIGRLEELSARHGIPYRGVTVRNQRTRWGSCSVHGSISLNINLARLPGALMDYVILHELVHTRIRGHGKDFWQGLDALVGDARGLRRELRKYGIALG